MFNNWIDVSGLYDKLVGIQIFLCFFLCLIVDFCLKHCVCCYQSHIFSHALTWNKYYCTHHFTNDDFSSRIYSRCGSIPIITKLLVKQYISIPIISIPAFYVLFCFAMSLWFDCVKCYMQWNKIFSYFLLSVITSVIRKQTWSFS